MLDSIVNLDEYRAFCFRGEGRQNVVISAKGRRDNIRIVWRLAKKRRSGLVNYKPKCRLINTYLEQFISPFLNNDYLIRAKLVHIKSSDLHHLAKIPYLPHNLKIEDFDELATRYSAENSRFPQRHYNNRNRNGYGHQNVCALEMPDATRIPRQLSNVLGPTLTLEIKSKQGFFQKHPGIDISFCNNCILQIEKWKSADFTTMYDFCPLSLYSGDYRRMCASLDSLIRDPHRNLRIFVNGSAVHEESSNFCAEELRNLLFPFNPSANIQTFISAITCILAGIPDDQERSNFCLQEGSILHDLLKAQRIDTVGIVRAYSLYKSLSPDVQKELRKKSNLLDRGRGIGFLERNDARSMVERYLLAATMKDCSLMISMRLVEKMPSTNENMFTALGGGGGYIRVQGIDGRPLCFAYSIRIVDLDPKSAKNLENAYDRFVAGVSMIRTNPNIHHPCISAPSNSA